MWFGDRVNGSGGLVVAALGWLHGRVGILPGGA